MDYGKEIKNIRKQLGLTQEELARELGISKILLGSIERGDRNLSEAVSIKLASVLALYEGKGKKDESFWQKYKQGRNLAKIVEKLRSDGYSIEYIREKLGTDRTDLSYMYVGLKSIPDQVKTLLTKEFYINIDYLQKGGSIRMFNDGNKSFLEIPYYSHMSFRDSLNAIYRSAPKSIIKYRFSSDDGPLDGFLDISGDNIHPTFNGNERLGITKCSLNSTLFGKLFIISLTNGENILRRVFPAKNDKILLKKEDPNFPQIEYAMEDIKEFYLVKMVISPDYI